MKKLIDLSEDVVKAITIQAVTEGTVFKLKAEQILNDYAKPFMVSDKQKKVNSKKVNHPS